MFFVFLIIFLFYFRSGLFYELSFVGHIFFRPVLVVANNINNKLSKISLLFVSKNSLLVENQDLKNKLNEQESLMANYNSVLDENIKIKEIFGRKNDKTPMILATILSKPNQSPYDILVIDSGAEQRIKTGNMVFAFGNVPIGRVAEVYSSSSKVVLFSTNKEKTQVILSGKDIFLEVTGRGGGNFEMILPRDFVLQKGDQVILPGINPRVLAVFETIISDPRDSFEKALLASPVNVQELKFVEVERE